MPRARDNRPRHQQIAAELRDSIMRGDLSPGTQLPSTAQLVAQYGVANATIQHALKALKDEGFLDSRVGKGVYVRDRQPFVIAAAYITPEPGRFRYRLLAVDNITLLLSRRDRRRQQPRQDSKRSVEAHPKLSPTLDIPNGPSLTGSRRARLPLRKLRRWTFPMGHR
ncbi:winged helix-turn-helix domain-containing protein [Actinocrispum sp. NPDC049592]|uniref:GntR family transcriptional regulator n=1 Tax=Actinocrispum sp. NPDC049592 TaxID=3154835 RepID=UPI00341C666E